MLSLTIAPADTNLTVDGHARVQAPLDTRRRNGRGRWWRSRSFGIHTWHLPGGGHRNRQTHPRHGYSRIRGRLHTPL